MERKKLCCYHQSTNVEPRFNNKGCPENYLILWFFTEEARLGPGSTVRLYIDMAAVQVYSSSSTSGPNKMCVPCAWIAQLCLEQKTSEMEGNEKTKLLLNRNSKLLYILNTK